MSETNETNLGNVAVSGLLIGAVSEGNLVSVKKLVQTHGLVNCDCGNGGYTLLFIAIKLGHIKIAKFLLQEGAKVDCGIDKVSTPLHLATQQGSAELVQLLLEKNMPVDAHNEKNETPLHLAAKGEYVNIVDILLNNNASLAAETDEGSTPLFFAIKSWNEEIVQMLLKHATANFGTSTKNSMLLEYILLRNPIVCDKVNCLVGDIVINDVNQSKIVDELIDHGFSLSYAYVNQVLLLAAVEKNYVKLIDNILRNCANLKDAEYSLPLLHTAIVRGHVEIIKLFLKSGFSPAFTLNEYGPKTLFYSLHCNEEPTSVEIIRLLLAYGGDLKEVPEILHAAINERLLEVCKVCIENGADVNARNSHGETPLYLAILKDRLTISDSLGTEKQINETRDKIAKFLLNSGADLYIETKGRLGEYPAFHHAVLSGRKDIVSIFLEYGVDVDWCDKNGHTPLFLACDKEHKEIVKLLCENNVDVNAWPERASMLYWSVCNRNEKIVKTLLKFGADIRFDFDDPMVRRSYEFSGMWMALEKHTIKLKVAGLPVFEQSISPFRYKTFQDNCEEEINQMKNQKLDTQFTLYDVLVNSKHPKFAKNKSLMRILKSFNLDAFPCYKNIIKSRLQISQCRLELLLSGQKWLDVLVKTSSKLNGKKYSVLPIEIFEQIVSFLSNSELRSLITCGESLKRRLSKK